MTPVEMVREPDTGLWRDPNAYLVRMTRDVSFESGRVLPAGTVVMADAPLAAGTVGHWREEGTCFALYPEDYEVVEGPITPRLFDSV